MEPKDVLIDHLSLCQEVYNVLIEENTWLKTKKSSPSIDILDRKKEMLPRLEKSLQNLKRLKPEFFSPFDNTKKLVNDSHSKLLQIFYLDRENEELLLKVGQSVERQTFHRFDTPPQDIDELHNRSGDTGRDLKEES